jgi:hypothetical protein
MQSVHDASKIISMYSKIDCDDAAKQWVLQRGNKIS